MKNLLNCWKILLIIIIKDNQHLYNLVYEVQRLSRKGVEHKLLMFETGDILKGMEI